MLVELGMCINGEVDVVVDGCIVGLWIDDEKKVLLIVLGRVCCFCFVV